MRRLAIVTLIPLALGLTACRSLVGPEVNDNPRITPTSRTGVTSEKGTSVYAQLPNAAAPK